MITPSKKRPDSSPKRSALKNQWVLQKSLDTLTKVIFLVYISIQFYEIKKNQVKRRFRYLFFAMRMNNAFFTAIAVIVCSQILAQDKKVHTTTQPYQNFNANIYWISARAMAGLLERMRRIPALRESMHLTGPGNFGVAEAWSSHQTGLDRARCQTDRTLWFSRSEENARA